jgi:hypothetical protein
MVWDRSWRVTCIPLLLWIACLTSAIVVLYYNHLNAFARSQKELFFSTTQWFRFGKLFYSCNIATNIYATCMYDFPASSSVATEKNLFSSDHLSDSANYWSNRESRPAPDMSYPCRIWGTLHAHKRHRLGGVCVLRRKKFFWLERFAIHSRGYCMIWHFLRNYHDLNNVVLQNSSMASISFNLILVRVAQTREYLHSTSQNGIASQ